MTSRNDLRQRVLHAVRLLGYAGTINVSHRAGTPPDETEADLLLAQAAGQVQWSRFGDNGGWSLTETSKAHGEKLLAQELNASNARPVAEAVMTGFEPLNQIVADACTRWQLTEMGISGQPASLSVVINDLARAAERWAELEQQLIRRLPRFRGYHSRFSTAVDCARTDPAWVTGTDRDSAHRVWFELHEDLLATLGRSR